EIITAGAAATHVGLGKLDEVFAGDGVDEFARLFGDALGVREVTGVVVGDFAIVGRGLTSAATNEIRSDDFGDVLDLRAEGFAAVIAEQVTIFFEGGAAAGGVDHDGVHVFEGADVVAGAFAGALEIAAVGV